MQAPVFTRTTPSQVIGLALVLGLAASITLNVVMLTRSDDSQSASTSTQAGVDLLARQQSYYAAKEIRQDAVEAAAGAQVARRGALTSSRQVYADLKADQLNGSITRTNTILRASQRLYVDLKSDQLNGIASAHQRFIEENTLLPQLAADVVSAAKIRLWDQNILPGDLQDVAPYTTTGETDY